jgi:hypothetical protein
MGSLQNRREAGVKAIRDHAYDGRQRAMMEGKMPEKIPMRKYCT